MPDHSITAAANQGPLPADDPARALALALPDAPGARHVFVAGNIYTVLIASADTQGRYCLIDMLISEGGGPPPHRHDFEEAFMLLEGELEFTFRGKTQTVAAPASINIPANAPHWFKNVSGKKARMLCLCTPGGQDEFFLAIGFPVASRDAAPPAVSDEERAAKLKLAKELSPKYRTEMVAVGG